MTFKEACFARSLLDDDREYVSTIQEAATWATGYCLHKLFVLMLLSSSLQQPNIVWERTSTILCDDIFYVPRRNQMSSGIIFRSRALNILNSLLI